jgi:hypothetical protein
VTVYEIVWAMIGQSIARILPNKIALPRAHDGAGEAFPVRASGHGADDAAQRGRCGDFLALGFLGVESWLRMLSFLSTPISSRVGTFTGGSLMEPPVPPVREPGFFGVCANISPSKRSARIFTSAA